MNKVTKTLFVIGIGVVAVGAGERLYHAGYMQRVFDNEYVPAYQIPAKQEVAAARKLNSVNPDSISMQTVDSLCRHALFNNNLVIDNYLFCSGVDRVHELGRQALNDAKKAHEIAANSVNSAIKDEISKMKPSDKSWKDIPFMKPGIPTTATGYPKIDLPVQKVQPQKLGSQNKGNQQVKVARAGLF